MRVNKLAGGLGADDGLMIAVWVFGTGYKVAIVYGVSEAGFGKHIGDLDPT